MSKNRLPDKQKRITKRVSKISYEHINNLRNICEMSFQQFRKAR